VTVLGIKRERDDVIKDLRLRWSTDCLGAAGTNFIGILICTAGTAGTNFIGIAAGVRANESTTVDDSRNPIVRNTRDFIIIKEKSC